MRNDARLLRCLVSSPLVAWASCLSLCVGLTGCMTVYSQLDSGHDEEEIYNGPYSGAINDVLITWCHWGEQTLFRRPSRRPSDSPPNWFNKYGTYVYLMAVDFPLSLAFDTVLLPISVFRIAGAKPEC